MLAEEVGKHNASCKISRQTLSARYLPKPKILRMAPSSVPAATGSASPAGAPPAQPPKLLERMRIHLRTRRYSIRTEEAYIDWARRFILFHGKRHRQEMGAAEVEAFLSHLAVDRRVSASTQNQA